MKAFSLYLTTEGYLTFVYDIGDLLGSYFRTFELFSQSLATHRKYIDRNCFENILYELLYRLGYYPSTGQSVINGKADFVMPSVEYYSKNPMDSVIFTAKNHKGGVEADFPRRNKGSRVLHCNN